MKKTDNSVILIIGRKSMVLDVLASFLSRETNTPSHCLEPDQSGSNAPAPTGDNKRLILIDCLEKDADIIKEEIKIDAEAWAPMDIPALINLKRGSGLEEKLLSLGMRGFFYEDDSMETLLKGVKVLLANELWVSREITTRFILEQSPRRQNRAIKTINDLTQRELEILKMVAVGETNEEIAGQLNISPNTVRTHLHNIFKKIDVPNRLQAALWVGENL